MKSVPDQAKADAEQEGKGRLDPVPPARGALAYLVAKDAARAIEWYREHFGAEVVFRLDAPSGGVMHSELRVGPAHFMLTDECAEREALGPLTLGGSSVTVVLYVPDVDAVVARAIAGGAKPGMPVADQFWGDRSGTVTDPFGHSWFISSRKEEPSPEEIQRRVQALYAQN